MSLYLTTMKTPLLLLVLNLLVALYPIGAANNQTPSSLSNMLKALDAVLDDSSEYVALREERISYLKELLTVSTTAEQQYSLSRKLFLEYYPYNFDIALSYGNMGVNVAEEMGNGWLRSGSHLDIARLYTVAGMYSEAIGAFGKIDTLRLPIERLGDFYTARIHFCRDFLENSKDDGMKRQYRNALNYYRNTFYNIPRAKVARIPNYYADSLSVRLLDYYDRGDNEKAKACAEQLVGSTRESEHAYAIAAYYMSIVAEHNSDTEGQMIWLARSAIADSKLAVKDNASLCALASLLASRGDVERAFRYIRISIDDAMFYNAKLRQWQVAGRMNSIEQAYQEVVRKQQRSSTTTTILMSLLACVLLFACLYAVQLLRKTRKTQIALKTKKEEVEAMNEALSQTNRQLQALNLSIAEANMVKEEYIGLFLSMCSDYIDKIASMQRRVRKGIKSGSIAELNREFPSSDIIDAEKEHFYEVFDSAFLNLYPNFVEEFNSLLEEDGQIELKKGERLNTELRIFALIRLGITDSSKIALLLHYSVNTIYNYRAKVKNRAKGDRENFEQVIKTIGSFKA